LAGSSVSRNVGSAINGSFSKGYRGKADLSCFGEASAFEVSAPQNQGRAAGTGEMSCRDTIHLICWYLEGKLSPSVEKEIERHLSECSDCHLVLDAANSTLDHYFGAGRSDEVPADTRAA
jgi:hypothetical protein